MVRLLRAFQGVETFFFLKPRAIYFIYMYMYYIFIRILVEALKKENRVFWQIFLSKKSWRRRRTQTVRTMVIPVYVSLENSLIRFKTIQISAPITSRTTQFTVVGCTTRVNGLISSCPYQHHHH